MTELRLMFLSFALKPSRFDSGLMRRVPVRPICLVLLLLAGTSGCGQQQLEQAAQERDKAVAAAAQAQAEADQARAELAAIRGDAQSGEKTAAAPPDRPTAEPPSVAAVSEQSEKPASPSRADVGGAAPQAANTNSAVIEPVNDSAPVGSVDDEKLLAAQQNNGNWLMYGRTYNSNRYSDLAQINTQNVASLQPVWTFQTGVLDGFECTPLVVDGIMYVTTP